MEETNSQVQHPGRTMTLFKMERIEQARMTRLVRKPSVADRTSTMPGVRKAKVTQSFVQEETQHESHFMRF